MKEPGEALRRAREERGLSLEQIASATKIRQSYLDAIETGNLAGLPHPYYARNFARVYAEHLGLDGDEIASLYPGPQPPRVPATLKVAQTSSDPWGLLMWVIVVLSVVMLGVYGYSRLTPPGALQSIPPLFSAGPAPTETTTSTPTLTPTTTPTPSYVGVSVVSVHISAPSWLYVLVDNKTEFSATLDTGATQSWTGKESVYMIAGNAGGVEVTYNGQPMGALGKRGEVVRMIWTPGQGAQTPTPVPPTMTVTLTPRPATPTHVPTSTQTSVPTPVPVEHTNTPSPVRTATPPRASGTATPTAR